MSSSRFYQPLLLGLALLFLVSVNFTQRAMTKARGQLGLTRLEPLDNAPPVLAFTTVALGGFRGLIANALWVRAIDMQDAGKYFEMVQLADWISKLEPHFASIWVVQAWNMAYNISIKFQDPADRWQWVKRGIELLRDDGLRFNPHETLIYRELAWFFQHKIGQNLDDAHFYFKKIWAEEMTKVLGGGRPNFEELLRPVSADARQRVDLLRNKYKMDPAQMKAVDARYGPLDWRLPETQAIYWAYVGLANCKTELMTLRRVVYQSMQTAFQRGRLTVNKYGNLYDLEPNLDMIPNANWSYEDMMQQDPEEKEQIKTGHRNFLKDAVYFLYSYNRLEEANRWYKYLAEKYPDKPLLMRPDSLPGQISMSDYALDRIQEDAGETSAVRVRALMDGLIGQAYINLALGFDDRAANFERQAQRIHARYQKKIAGSETRVGLASLNEIKKEMLGRLLGPDSAMDDQTKAQLRTALNLKPGEFGGATTNAPSTTISPTNSVSPSNAPPSGNSSGTP